MTTGQKQQQGGPGTPADRDPAASGQDQGQGQGQDQGQDQGQRQGQRQDQTFETDISETGDDGTTVRQAEVREDDLSETKPPSQDDNL
jgi:hypothetical protein